MQYYSTRLQAPLTTLAQAIMHSEAPDGGLYLPKKLPVIPAAIINNLAFMSLSDISYFVANTLFAPDIPSRTIKQIGEKALNFPIPLVQISPDIYALELFHGPTATVKDVCARYMAHILGHFGTKPSSPINILVATNGNSGSALANAAMELPGVNLYAIYPKDAPAEFIAWITEAKKNDSVKAVPVDGTIDDCRNMIASALADKKLNEVMPLTSANAYNIGIVLPQIIYYFHAWAQLKRQIEKLTSAWIGVPCGNAGGLMAGYMAKQMGLPIERLVASCNSNDALHRFFSHQTMCSNTGYNLPKPCFEQPGRVCRCEEQKKTVRTLAYAMDTGCPSNIPRFYEMCHANTDVFKDSICSGSCTDQEILETIAKVKADYGYVLDPHTAVAYKCLAQNLPAGAKGIVMATRRGGKEYAPIQKAAKWHSLAPIPPTYPALRKVLEANNKKR